MEGDSNFERILLENYATHGHKNDIDIERAGSKEDTRGSRIFVRCLVLE